MTVIFDLDGTLLNTPAGIVDVVRRTADELGFAAPSEEVVQSMIGKPLRHMFNVFGWPASTTDQAIDLFRALFSEHVVSKASELVFPGIEQTLDILASRHRLGVATSKIVRSAEEILSASGLRGYFDVVAGTDSVENPKPSPDMALHVANVLESSPSACVVIGDSIYDMEMAVAAGMKAVGVTWGVDTPKNLSAAGASILCRDPYDLPGSLIRFPLAAKEVRLVDNNSAN